MGRGSIRHRVIAGAIVAIVMLGMLFGLSDARELWRRAREISLAWAAAATALALLAFLCMAATQRSLLSALGHRLPIAFMVRASWLSLAVSRVLRSGGVSGVIVIAWLLRLRGVPAATAASMKIGEFLLTNIVFTALLAGGAVGLAVPTRAVGANLSGPLILLAMGSTGVFLLLGLLWRAVVLERRRRVWVDRAVRWATLAGHLFRRRNWGERSRPSIDSVSRTSQKLLSNPASIARAQGWAFLRIAGSAATAWACAEASHLDADALTILFAWCLSTLAAVILFVPAGLGVVEASLTAVLASLGASFEAALLTALLYRLTYHLIPTALALALAGSLLKQARTAAAGAAAP